MTSPSSLPDVSPCDPQVDGEYDAWMEVLCLICHGGALHDELHRMFCFAP